MLLGIVILCALVERSKVEKLSMEDGREIEIHSNTRNSENIENKFLVLSSETESGEA